MRFLLIILFFVVSASVDAQQPSHLIRQKLDSSVIPGMVYAVVTKDSILHMEAMGYRRADQKTPENLIQINDKFLIGSNTKAMTAYLAADMVEKGKISWTTRFTDILPEWKDSIHTAYQNITLWQLVSLRAGIPAFTLGTEFVRFPKPASVTIAEKRIEFCKYVLKQNPANTNNAFHYSNASYSLAALMLETVAGDTWENLLQKLFSQKNIQLSFGWPNREDINQPWGHWTLGGKFSSLSPKVTYQLNFIEPAGNVNISLPEYIKWIQMNLQGLSDHDPVIEKLHDTSYSYSGGWGIQNQISFHNGSDGAFFVSAELDRKTGKAVIIMINYGGAEANKFIQECIAVLRQEK